MFLSKFVICLALAILYPFLANVRALTARQNDHIRKLFEREGEICLEANILTEEELAEIQGLRIPSSDSVGACFLACVWKKIGLMNNAGMLQQNLPETIESVFSEYELGPIETFYISCLHMNLEVVSDGEKGCERAVLSFKCMVENAPKFGLKL